MRRKVEETTASRRARRSFTPSFKAEVVALVRQGNRTVPAICREMDLSETAVRRWVQQAAVDAGERDGLTSDEREELRRLRREVRVLRDERGILKRGGAFFAVGARWTGTGSSRGAGGGVPEARGGGWDRAPPAPTST